ncbi:MAG TPA: NAD-dependent protein deacylase [Gaiella sp.]|nr:NAD-dependent protein deacylase [Gaiella sp.]
MDTEAAKLARLIVKHQPCVAFTGAGVSTESGVPDFRSPTGIWAEFDPLEYATLGAFRRDPRKIWRFYAPRFSMLMEAEPNAAHLALAELERLGLVRAVVTQNIDRLHERAGSRDVIEVHGSIRTSSCPSCGVRYELAEVAPLIEAGDGAPACPACGAILKPDVVFFDELLPEGALERAQALAEEARLLLVVGSSLEVQPVADLPHATLAAGGSVAVVNRTPTWVDGRAALVLRNSAGEVLAGVVAALRAGPLELAEYDPAWPRLYEEEAARVREALGDAALAVEHMGSTAVPGLGGKPVIDISVGLRRPELSPEQVAALERLGYEYLGEFGLPGRLFFRREEDGRRTHHVHAVEHGGERWHSHRAFRDYLRAHPEEAEAYAAEKRRAAAEATGLADYWELKQPYVDALFARAWAWYAERP